jgi:phosphatidate cytidylyltransferase
VLRWRFLLGTTFIAALVGLMVADYHAAQAGSWLIFLALVLAVAAAQEVVTLFAAGGYAPLSSVVYGGSLLVVASNAVPMFFLQASDDPSLGRLGWPLSAFAASFLFALIGEMARYQQPGGVIVRAALATFGVAYVGVLLSFAVQLRVLGGPVDGMVAIIALVAVVKMSDIGAYTVGRLIGRHKMAPKISPGKTLEGAAGAIVFALLAAWLVFTFLPRWLPCVHQQRPWAWAMFGVVVGVAGILGDLAESLLKRDMGRKDSSQWLPGFGGVLDLLDSILFAAPVAYLCWLVGMQ